MFLICRKALYASDGAAILQKDGGIIIKLDEDEKEKLFEFIKSYQVVKSLKVNNRTYEVCEDSSDLTYDVDESEYANSSTIINEDAFSNTSTRFEHKYCKTPDIVRMAIPHMYGNRKGLMYVPTPITHVGERVEIDVFEFDYVDPKTYAKLPSHGGAIAAALCVDCFSGYLMAKLLQSKANSEKFVTYFINQYNLQQTNITLIASDSGVVSQKVFEVTGEV
jgi:hypothetical protein